MFDIMFDIELNKIKKRYGNIVSFNTNQTCGFLFMNDEFVRNKSVAAIFSRGDKVFAIELTKDNEEYTCHFPDELCDSAKAYKLTLVAFTNDTDAPSDFRSTVAYCGTIEESGVSGTDFAPKHSETIFDKVGNEYRIKLAKSLATATGESQDGKTWDELNDTVAELPIISEEQTQALGDWDLIKFHFANFSGMSHSTFKTAPIDENGNSISYTLPYIYTPKLKWEKTGGSAFTTYLKEAGVDVTSAQALGSRSSGHASPFANTGIQRLVLTGNANARTLENFMKGSTSLEYIKFDTPSKEKLEANSEYYYVAFTNCKKLRTIDCELDFTGQTAFVNTFLGCNLLRDLRIKPFTLSASLYFGNCQFLHVSNSDDYDSLISILNGITLDKEVAKNITLTFSSAITDITQGMVHFWNCNVYATDSGLYYAEPPKDEVCLEVSLYEAFMARGVTIKWQ